VPEETEADVLLTGPDARFYDIHNRRNLEMEPAPREELLSVTFSFDVRHSVLVRIALHLETEEYREASCRVIWRSVASRPGENASIE
jgi:hypothetical protein